MLSSSKLMTWLAGIIHWFSDGKAVWIFTDVVSKIWAIQRFKPLIFCRGCFFSSRKSIFPRELNQLPIPSVTYRSIWSALVILDRGVTSDRYGAFCLPKAILVALEKLGVGSFASVIQCNQGLYEVNRVLIEGDWDRLVNFFHYGSTIDVAVEGTKIRVLTERMCGHTLVYPPRILISFRNSC
jgi:hypothetical protein